MAELVVEPSGLQALARPLADVGASLDAVVASGVRGARAACGPEVAEALEEFAVEWSSGLSALAASATAAGAALASVASAYDAVDALGGDWAAGS